MLIKIEDDVFENLDNALNSFDERILAIDSLFDSMYKGKHIVYSSALNLNKLIKTPQISERTKLFVSWLLKKFPTIYSCINIVNEYISISAKYTMVERCDNFFKIPIDYALDISETKLLTEHESDAKYYIQLSEYIQKKQGISTLYTICYENDSYHGTNGKAKIEQVAENKKIVLCIADTDKDYPEDSRKSTYRCVNDAIKKVKKKIPIDLFELPVREKENLFPATIYKEFSNNGLIKVIADFFSEDEVIAGFFDIKSGIKYKKVLDTDEKWVNYFEPLLTKCKSHGICHTELTEEECEKYYIDGIGEKLCGDVADALFSHDENLIKKHFSSLTKEEIDCLMKKRNQILDDLPMFVVGNWTKLSRKMFSWGCCVDKKRYPAQREW